MSAAEFSASRGERTYRTSASAAAMAAAENKRTVMPSTSCFRCEARGWCKHRQPGDV